MSMLNRTGDEAGALWEKTAFGIIATLIATGVIGLFTLSNSVSRLDERVALWTRIYESRFERLDQEFQELRRRGAIGNGKTMAAETPHRPPPP
jgi:hypothetical protein